MELRLQIHAQEQNYVCNLIYMEDSMCVIACTYMEVQPNLHTQEWNVDHILICKNEIVCDTQVVDA
jgi:hypothetical protein